MGRQINFYMDYKVEKEFQEFILKQGLIIVSKRIDQEMIINDISYKKNKIYIMQEKEIENLRKSDMPGKEDSIQMLRSAWPY